MNLDQANQELKAARAGLTIRIISNRLYLRGTLPPKPGSKITAPHQQNIALGIYANPQGIKRAKAEGLRIGGLLACKEFHWEEFQRHKPKFNPGAIGGWIEKFEEEYFRRRARTPKTQTSFEDYKDAFKLFPSPEAPLTAEAILEAALRTPADTRQRSRACITLKALAKFAEVQINLKPYKGNYSPYEAIQARDIPSLELIEKSRSAIDNPSWRWAVGILAAYGLRPHELFYLDLRDFHKPPGILVLGPGGKSGPRKIWPLFPQWWELWNLGEGEPPICTGKNNSELGQRVDRAFHRYKLPFVPYDLRHFWAIQAAVRGLNPSIAAKMMGHSLDTHYKLYHRWLDDRHLQSAWEEMIRHGGQGGAAPEA